MNYTLFSSSFNQKVIALYTSVFAESEGEEEGQTIGNLVSNLIKTTAPQDLIGCIAENDNAIVGCIFFSRFFVPDIQSAFLLSPVAIATNAQRKGIGQQLIRYGLDHLKAKKVNLVFTYGDPAYYSKTGFHKINENIVKAPFKLSQPEGWLAQSLDGKAIPRIEIDTQCVDAFQDQKYW